MARFIICDNLSLCCDMSEKSSLPGLDWCARITTLELESNSKVDFIILNLESSKSVLSTGLRGELTSTLYKTVCPSKL